MVWRIQTPEQIEVTRIRKQRYYQENKPKFKQYRYDNREQRREYISKYQKNNPEKRLVIMKRHFEKYGKVFDMTYVGYINALIMWSKTIKKLDNNMCKLCGSIENLNSHHIQPKGDFPELSLFLDNGITLCEECHGEIHGFDIY